MNRLLPPWFPWVLVGVLVGVNIVSWIYHAEMMHRCQFSFEASQHELEKVLLAGYDAGLWPPGGSRYEFCVARRQLETVLAGQQREEESFHD